MSSNTGCLCVYDICKFVVLHDIKCPQCPGVLLFHENDVFHQISCQDPAGFLFHLIHNSIRKTLLWAVNKPVNPISI